MPQYDKDWETKRARALLDAHSLSPRLISSAWHDTLAAEATYECGSLIIRIWHERRLELLEVTSSSRPTPLFYFQDVEVSLGWRPPPNKRAKVDHYAIVEGEDIELVVRKLADHFHQLQLAFSSSNYDETRTLIERAYADRRKYENWVSGTNDDEKRSLLQSLRVAWREFLANIRR